MEEIELEAPQYDVRLEVPPSVPRLDRFRVPEELRTRNGSLTRAPRMEGNSPQIDDLSLLRKTAAGDEKAFHELVDRHAQRMFRLAVSLVGNAADAEDVVQEAFTGAFRGIKGFEGRASVKTWLTRILITQAAKWRRDKKRRAFSSIDAVSEQAGPPGGETGVGQRMDLQAAIAQLSVEHREVIVLREFEQMSYDDMAQALNVPRGTIESRLHRARVELREKLAAYLA